MSSLGVSQSDVLKQKLGVGSRKEEATRTLVLPVVYSKRESYGDRPEGGRAGQVPYELEVQWNRVKKGGTELLPGEWWQLGDANCL